VENLSGAEEGTVCWFEPVEIEVFFANRVMVDL
jgi:hypothetical protein